MQIGVDSSLAVDNKRVFVVDTDEITRMAAVFMLHDEHETHELADIAAVYAKARDWMPDVLALGVGVVQAEGIGVLAELKQRIPGVKILLLADAGTETFVHACRQAGADAAFVKPLEVGKLRTRVAALLGRRKPIVIHAI
ncbi:MAG: response regulator transcription factor [Gammaproteobacteria bacterium]|nr:response regulator transcription factor [Gammaproteobacteria bacterium]